MLETLLHQHLGGRRAAEVLDALDSLESDNALRLVLSALASDLSRADPLVHAAFVVEAERSARLATTAESVHATRESSLSPAVVIAGLPRTGSTLLQYELAVRSRAGTPLGWEYSVQRLERLAADGVDVGVTAATEEIAEQYDSLCAMNPAVHELHPLGPALPEECTPIFRSSGRFMPWLLLFDAPSAEELLLADMAIGESTLPHSHWAGVTALIERGAGTVLKSPLHTPYLRALKSSVSEATRIVVVRRDAPSVLRSFAELAFQVRSTIYAAKPERTNRISLAILEALCRGFESSTGADVANIVEFEELVSDPAAVARAILPGPVDPPTWDRTTVGQRPAYPELPTFSEKDLESLRCQSPTLLS